MAQDLELADRVVGEADAVEIEVDDAAGIETGGGEKGHAARKSVKGEK